MPLLKRSLTLHKHRTSLALEPEFWEVLEDLARSRALSLSALVAEIDDAREIDAAGVAEDSLSSSLRVAALNHCRKRP
jgi:predicted DNA-binding ribbon-helix-helix protein